MTFAWPAFLWLLILPASIAAWEFFRRHTASSLAAPQRILRGEAGARTVAVVGKQPSRLSRFHIAHPWLLLGLACGIVALARPQWGIIEEQVFDQSREIVIAIDLSRSMLTPDVKPSRLERSKLLIQALLDRLAGERVGLIVFSGTAFLQCPLSADYEILREFLPSLSPKYLPEGGTNYASLLKTSLEAFAGGSGAADRFLIILSDGEALDDQWRPLIDDLKKRGVRALCLGVGTSGGGMIPEDGGGFVKDERGAVVLSKLASSTLQDLASATGGAYRDASTWVDLPRLLQDTVEAGRQGRFEEKREVRRIERFQWALGPCLLFVLLSWWREFPVRIRPRSIPFAPVSASAAPSVKRPSAPAASSIVPLLLIAGTSLLALSPSASTAFAATQSSLPAGIPVTPIGAPPSQQAVSPEAGKPLSLTVKRLSEMPNPLARDWAAMANDTLAWGQHLRGAQQTVPPGPINDGLAAVDAGEKLDPRAADWKTLRKDLLALLRQDPQQKPQDQNKEQSQSQDNKQKDQKDGDSPKQEPQKDSQPEQKNQGQEDKNRENQPQSRQENKNDEKQKNGSDNKKESTNSAPQQESAFGEMNKQPPKDEQQKSQPQEMQKVGGSEKKDPAESNNPALTVPLQRLEKIKEQDSPARLFQILEGQKKGAPSQPGRNW